MRTHARPLLPTGQCGLQITLTFQLNALIEQMLADPRRILPVRKELHLGQTDRRAADGPNVWSGVWQEMAAHRLWLDRAVVPAFAGTTGLAVVGVKHRLKY